MNMELTFITFLSLTLRTSSEVRAPCPISTVCDSTIKVPVILCAGILSPIRSPTRTLGMNRLSYETFMAIDCSSFSLRCAYWEIVSPVLRSQSVSSIQISLPLLTVDSGLSGSSSLATAEIPSITALNTFGHPYQSYSTVICGSITSLLSGSKIADTLSAWEHKTTVPSPSILILQLMAFRTFHAMDKWLSPFSAITAWARFGALPSILTGAGMIDSKSFTINAPLIPAGAYHPRWRSTSFAGFSTEKHCTLFVVRVPFMSLFGEVAKPVNKAMWEDLPPPCFVFNQILTYLSELWSYLTQSTSADSTSSDSDLLISPPFISILSTSLQVTGSTMPI